MGVRSNPPDKPAGFPVNWKLMMGAFGLIINGQMKNRTKIYTVSEVNSLIKEILENNLPKRLTIKGEISNWRVGPTGHRYFSLKDENSIFPCAMWKSSFSSVKFKVENGMAVLATGSIEIYIPHGRYQFIVDDLEPEGVGARQLALEQMKKKLRTQGLFDEAHKKPIPPYPERIGILTSESGAAIEDIKDSIWNRWPCVRLFLYPVPVQGEGAAAEIAAGIRDINRRNKKLKLDILIVGRGGGSMEDLWAFNEEVLARAIFDSKIPVISAVGHEVDTTIADLVADARASTPTKAGVVAVPDMQEVLGQLAYFQKRLGSVLRAKLELCQENLHTILASASFRKPLLIVHNAEQQLDELGANLSEVIKRLLVEARDVLHDSYEQVIKIEPHRLLGRKTVDLHDLRNRANVGVRVILNDKHMQLASAENQLVEKIKGLLVEKQRRLSTSYERVVRIEPHRQIGRRMVELSNLSNRANVGVGAILNKRQMELTGAENRLAGLNPKSVLQRGYSITTNKKTSLLVRNLADVQIADCIITELAGENLIESKVTNKQNRNK
jgi:exodeoxyribonuclease VII large subunit